MAQVIWSEPALIDLDAIADYSALENPEAAPALVQKVSQHVEQLAQPPPKSGPTPPELKGWRYRQIVELPCRIFYREDGERVFILYVMRAEHLLRPAQLSARARGAAATAGPTSGSSRERSRIRRGRS